MRSDQPLYTAAFILVMIASGPTWATSNVEEEVWRMEESYWRYATAGDVEGYVSLWHESFIGWPCLAAQPTKKESVAGWVRQIRDGEFTVAYNLHRETVQSFGDVAVAYYSTPIVYTYPDGSTRYQGQLWKFTHTWMKVGEQWQMIGGMCGVLDRPAEEEPAREEDEEEGGE